VIEETEDGIEPEINFEINKLQRIATTLVLSEQRKKDIFNKLNKTET
jgi:hypothetical protein